MCTVTRHVFARLVNIFIAFTLLLPSLATAQPALAAPASVASAPAQPAVLQNTTASLGKSPAAPAGAPAATPAISMPEATPEPTPLPPAVGLTLSAQPDAILPGSPVTLTWTVENWDLLALPAILEITLPEGLKALSPSQDGGEKERSAEKARDTEQSGTDEKDSPAASTRGDEKIIRIPLKEPGGTLELAVAETARGPFSFFAAISSGKETIASASLTLAEDHATTIGPEGGVAIGLGGRVQVHFPAGAVCQGLCTFSMEPVSFAGTEIRLNFRLRMTA